jgi:membrane protein
MVLGRLQTAVPLVATLRAAGAAYGRHACSELAAAIAYRILFSLVPFIALLAAVLEAVLPADARADVIEWLVGVFPGTTVRSGVEQELAASGALLSLAGLIAFGTLIWTASGMTRSLRVALAVVWESGERPDFVRAKLRDIAALGVLAALVLCVFMISLITQIAVQAGVDATDALGFSGAATAIATGAELGVTAAATFAGLVIVYRLGAPTPLPLAAVWRSALTIAVAIDVALAGYAFYLVRLASFETIYGPLGAVLAFLALVYIAAALVLFGAELIIQSR